MSILQIHVVGVAIFESKRNTVIATHIDRPRAFPVAFQFVEITPLMVCAASKTSSRLTIFFNISCGTDLELPFSKTSFSPLCLNVLITLNTVMCRVTPVNVKTEATLKVLPHGFQHD